MQIRYEFICRGMQQAKFSHRLCRSVYFIELWTQVLKVIYENDQQDATV